MSLNMKKFLHMIDMLSLTKGEYVMNLPTLNINEIADLSSVIGTIGSSINNVASAGTDDLIIIIATYLVLGPDGNMSILF